jgi:hypothetical protein
LNLFHDFELNLSSQALKWMAPNACLPNPSHFLERPKTPKFEVLLPNPSHFLERPKTPEFEVNFCENLL